MKKIVIILLFIQFSAAIRSQNSREVFAGQNAHPVTREELLVAELVSEVIPGYPTHWDHIISLVSVKLKGIVEGEVVSAESQNAFFSDAQKTILRSADPGTKISIDIRFRWKDTLSALGEYGKIQKMNDINLVVAPHKEAEFAAGPEKITTYLENNFYKKIGRSGDKYLPPAEGFFTIDENGHISDAHFIKPFPDPEVERLLLEALSRMPDWKPAMNQRGTKIRQVFSFYLPIPNNREMAKGRSSKNGC